MKRQYSLHLNETFHSNEIIKDFFLKNGFRLVQEEENKLDFTKENSLWNISWLRLFMRHIHVIIVKREEDIYIYSSTDYFWEFLNIRNEKRWDQFFAKLKKEYFMMQSTL